MRAKAAQDKLQAAMQKADKSLLEAAIKEFRQKKVKSSGTELEKEAQRLLDRLALKECKQFSTGCNGSWHPLPKTWRIHFQLSLYMILFQILRSMLLSGCY